ncbi:MAG: hypothetical protein ACI4OG_01630 [Bacilli bacterium]
MKKGSILIIILVFLFSIFIGYEYFQDKKQATSQDAVNFEKEYENLNNRVNSNNNKVYPTVDISSDNPIKYSSYDEIFEILESGTGVIYLGFPECPWCRNLVPVLLSAAKEVELDTLYYLNIKEDRDLLLLDENKDIITEKEGNKKYFELVEKLDQILDEYILTANDGSEVKTGEKRIYLPIVIFVKNGEIVGYHDGTVESQEDPYVALTDRENEELLLSLIELMMKVSPSVCDDKC